MKRFFIVASMVLLTSFFMLGCNDTTTVDLSTIDIEAIDHVDVAVGTYTVEYTIEDLGNLVKTYGAEVSIVVLNRLNQEVEVSGNTFVVEADEVYTVTITLTVNGESKEKTVTVTAIASPTQVTVTFDLSGGEGYSSPQIIDINSVPDLTKIPTRDGYTFAGWFIDPAFTTRYTGVELNEDTTLYAKWVVSESGTTVVSFDLNGGVGSFPDLMVTLGDTLSEPTTIPSKEGYDFVGWFTSVEGTEEFGFDTTAIYATTVLYAHWEVNSANVVKVTYDLNGALQTSLLEENVLLNSHPLGLSITPVYSGFVFAGWSLDQDGMVPLVLEDLSLTEDTTLYAIWHLDLVVMDGSEYFAEFTVIENSTLNDGVVEQRMDLYYGFEIGDFVSDNNITADRLEFGILYSESSQNISYYDLLSTKVEGVFPPFVTENYNTLADYITTTPLLSDTSYNVVLYFRFDGIIVYSSVYQFKTLITVPTGTSVGCDYIVSGGYYAYDNGNFSFRPSMFALIEDGFSATLDHVPYSSYSDIHYEGTRSLVTTNTLTGEQYLHVFHVDFQTPDVTMTYKSLEMTNETFVPTYGIDYAFLEYISYPISEVGVIYSFEHPFLKIGLNDVHKIRATMDSEDISFSTISAINGSQRDVYIRGYAIINGKISYSTHVTKLEWSSDEYVVTNSYQIDSNKISPEYGYSYSFGSTSMNLWTFTESYSSYETYTNSIEISAEGQYFITAPVIASNIMIFDVLIIDDFPKVVGVEEGGVYNHPVFVEYNTYNPYWYFSVDGSDYVDLPQKVMLSEAGYYTIYYRSATGILEIHFQITDAE